MLDDIRLSMLHSYGLNVGLVNQLISTRTAIAYLCQALEKPVGVCQHHREISRDAQLEFIVSMEIWSVCLHFSVSKNKVTQPHTKKFHRQHLVDDDKIVN